jgi:hypothetical protein
MSMRMATCGSKAVGGSPAELLGMVSMAVQTVPDSFLFPFPLSLQLGGFTSLRTFIPLTQDTRSGRLRLLLEIGTLGITKGDTR